MLFLARIDLQQELDKEQNFYREFIIQYPFACLFALILFVVTVLLFSWLIRLVWKKLLLPNEFFAGTWNAPAFFMLIWVYLVLHITLVFAIPDTFQKNFLIFWLGNFGFCFAIGVWALGEENGKKMIGLSLISSKEILASLLGYGLFLPIFLLSYVTMHILYAQWGMQAHTQQIATEIINSTGAQFWIGAMTAVVGAPLFEELIFRVFLYSNLRKAMGISLAMFFSAFLFALMHANLFAFFPIFLLGLFFAILYEKTQSLLIPALAHATHNGLTLAYLCFSFR